MATQSIDSLMIRTRRRWRKIHNRTSFWRGAWLFLIFLAIAAAADVFWRFDSEIRNGMRWTILAVLVLSFCYYLWAKWRRRRPEDYFASVLEQKDPHLATRLINAVQFRRVLQEKPPVGISTALMEAEIERGEEVSTEANPKAALDPRPARRQFFLFALLAVLVGIGHGMYPDLLQAVVPRFTDPYGDHPPFSLTRYEVQPGNTTIMYGEKLEIKTKVEGPPAEALVLSYRSEGSQAEPVEVPMFRSPDGSYIQQIAALTEPVEYLVKSEKGWSHRYHAALDTAPCIKILEARRDFPVYTRQKSDTIKLRLSPSQSTVVRSASASLDSSPALSGVKETMLTFRVESNRPLGAGQVSCSSGPVVIPPVSLRPVAGNENQLTGEMPIRASGEYVLSVTDADGTSGKDRTHLRLVRIPDDAPAITMAEPGVFSMAIPSATLPVSVSADDDFGIEEMTLHYRTGDDEWKEVRQDLAESRRDFGDLSTSLPLSQMNVKPGDRIEMYASARDNDPNGSKIARTPIHTVQIISEEEYQKMAAERRTSEEMLKEYGSALEQLDDLLKTQEELQRQTEELAREATENQGALTPEQQEATQELAQSQVELASETAQLAREWMRRDNRPGATPMESEMNRKLAEMGRQMSQNAQNPMERAAQQLNMAQNNNPSLALSSASLNQEDAANALRSLKEGPAQDMREELKQIEQVAELFNDVRRFFQVFEEQKRLTAEMQALKSKTDPSATEQHEMVQLGEEERELAGRLEDLREDFKKHGEPLRENYPKLSDKADEIAQDLEDLATAGKMEKSAERLEAAQAGEGHQRALEALADLESLMEKANQCEQCLSDDLNLSMNLAQGGGGSGSGMGAMAETLNQLMQNKMRSGQGMGSGGFSLYGPEGEEGGRTSPNSKRHNKKKKELYVETPEGLAAPLVGVLEPVSPSELEILMGMKERYPRLYEELIAAYYRRLAEEPAK